MATTEYWWSSFYCPISGELMHDPVASKYGHLYERESIEEWVRRKSNCPYTGRRLEREDLFPVYALKADITEFRRRLQEESGTAGQLSQWILFPIESL